MAKYLFLRNGLVLLKTSTHCGMPIFLKVNHQLESRIQEIWQSGSEGGAKPTFVPTPIVFNFSACYTHNYREFMSGFTDWVETVAESRDRLDYRRRVNDAESVSMWQSLGFGPNYKAAYCMAVCPAGEDVIGEYLNSKKEFTDEVVRPLQAKKE